MPVASPTKHPPGSVAHRIRESMMNGARQSPGTPSAVSPNSRSATRYRRLPVADACRRVSVKMDSGSPWIHASPRSGPAQAQFHHDDRLEGFDVSSHCSHHPHPRCSYSTSLPVLTLVLHLADPTTRTLCSPRSHTRCIHRRSWMVHQQEQ